VIRSIVVGTDGSDTATEAVRQASDLAKSVGAKVHIVSAYEPIAGARVGGGDPETPVSPDFEVDSVLEQASGIMHAQGVEYESHARKGGDPADVILRVAEEQGADVIMVGSRGMQGAKRFLLGSVPNKISHHASCSVLIVRTTSNKAIRPQAARWVSGGIR
jgi:nucleotide-binding universal stress UspA family protein